MIKRILCLVFSLVFVLSLCACGDQVIIESEVIGGGAVATEGGEDGTPTDGASGGAQGTAGTGNSEKDGIDLKALKGTTVKVLMWRALTDQEKKTIAAFEKKYSMKVKVDTTSTASYMTKIASLVSTKQSPDLGVLPGGKTTQGAFPLGAAAVFQPASATKQDFSDGFWFKEAMNAYKIKGQYFVMAAENANWYNCHNCLFYNADMFKTDKLTTPYTLWKQGNWNWDTMKSTAEALVKKGHDYGIQIDQDGNLMSSTGSEFVSYDGKKFTNNTTSQNVIKAWTYEAQLVEKGLMPKYGTQTNAFTSGKAGMIATNLWAMRKGEMLQTAGFKIECVPFPSPKGQAFTVGASVNMWAIPKGAKNPVGAGVFLRYFLDAANNGKFSDVAINPQFEETFKYLSSNKVKYHFMYNSGVVGYSNLKALQAMYTELHSASSTQITTVLQKNSKIVQNSVNTANKKLG